MKRVRFRKGMQRRFLKKILFEIGCSSLRELRNRGIDIPYSTLKNYYSEKRFLPEIFFRDLCLLAKMNKKSVNLERIDSNWGQIIGGKKSKRGKK